MASSLIEINKQLNNFRKLEASLSSGMDSTMSLAKDILNSSSVVSSEEMESLKACMLEYADMDVKLHNFHRIAEGGVHQLKNTPEDAREPLYADIKEKLRSLVQAEASPDAESHKKYLDLCSFIDEFLDTAEAKEEAGGDEDCFYTVTETGSIPIDPITQEEVKDPVKNRHCHHTYDRASITQYIRTKRNAKCPQVPCINNRPLRPEDLVENVQVLRLINRRNAERN